MVNAPLALESFAYLVRHFLLFSLSINHHFSVLLIDMRSCQVGNCSTWAKRQFSYVLLLAVQHQHLKPNKLA